MQLQVRVCAVDRGPSLIVHFQTIINLCMALGFLVSIIYIIRSHDDGEQSFQAHGYATHEFEVTADRLGVYLPTEHIDNPKGYAEGEDARQYHPNLRGPVDVCMLFVIYRPIFT